jgi:hypothetical protein
MDGGGDSEKVEDRKEDYKNERCWNMEDGERQRQCLRDKGGDSAK